MFETTSRYYALETAIAEIAAPDGTTRTLSYRRRRFLPPPGEGETVVEHSYAQGERLDVITARYLGDPTQFWRICDANLVLRPGELEAEVGRLIRVALPQP